MKYFKFLFSGALMGILLIAFAGAIAKATFIENDYDAATARVLVYNAWWFEAILVLMVVNFSGMIFTKKLYTKGKLNILLIHIALIVVIIGAGVTRYIGFEGQMHIRNGETSDTFRSAVPYIYLKLNDSGDTIEISEKITLSPIRENIFNSTVSLNDKDFKIAINRYLPDQVERLVPVENGSPYVTIIIGTPQGRQEFFIKEGETKNFPGLTMSFGDTTDASIVHLIRREGLLYIKSPEMIISSRMQSDPEATFEPDRYYPVDMMTVQRIGNVSFVLTQFEESAEFRYVPAIETEQGVDLVEVIIDGERKQIRKGYQEAFDVNNVSGTIYVGSMKYELPFSLKLNEFELERYPGSSSPSSFASDVVVIDEEKSNRFEYRIFMNNVLNYRGYRFFQSSYDQDEMGTILSVNHDYWGTLITYIGYALLFGGLIVSLFTRTRVHNITQQINEIHAERKKVLAGSIVALLLATMGTVKAQDVKDIPQIDKQHASNFGKLIVQSPEGRFEPANTVANKILVKVYKKSSYMDLNADQVFLGMISNPEYWQNVPLIKVSEAGLRGILDLDGDYASYSDLLDGGVYKLKEYVDRAYMKKPALRSTFDKEVIYVDERLNVLYMTLNRRYLNIFPIPDHPEDKWTNPDDFHQLQGHGTEKGDLFENYILGLEAGITTGDYAQAETALVSIQDYQNSNGGELLPSEARVKLEIFYNEVNIFKRLFPFFFVIGIILVGIFFLQTFNPNLKLNGLQKVLTGILVIAFVLQTFGLGLRWYVSGHAPWSNGYESMIYIAWATMLAGFIFMKKSQVSLAVTSVLAGITLLTAHMSWLNPEITNLVPVLKSYWLTIHVATITASYGFLALACMMGFLNLWLLIFRNRNNQLRVTLMLKELTLIVELSLSVGLILLIIGNFLGGVWANESWGRYWGWDPKESWTLITVIFYSFVLHMRLIPGIRSPFTFNFFALIGFGCVLMTYFGVNYYLSGLHSYANGDPVPVPNFVYYTILVIFIVSGLAAFNEQRMNRKAELTQAA